MNLIVACAAGTLAVIAWRTRIVPGTAKFLETIGSFGDDFFSDN